MTEHSYSVEDIIKFLKSAQSSGVLKFNTARTRRTAITQLSKFFTDIEKADLRNIDKNTLADRIRDISNIQEGTIQTYLTRLDKSIASYKSYIEGKLTEPANSTNTEIKPKEVTTNAKETVVVFLDSGIPIKLTNIPKSISRKDIDTIYSALLLLVDDQQEVK